MEANSGIEIAPLSKLDSIDCSSGATLFYWVRLRNCRNRIFVRYTALTKPGFLLNAGLVNRELGVPINCWKRSRIRLFHSISLAYSLLEEYDAGPAITLLAPTLSFQGQLHKGSSLNRTNWVINIPLLHAEHGSVPNSFKKRDVSLLQFFVRCSLVVPDIRQK